MYIPEWFNYYKPFLLHVYKMLNICSEEFYYEMIEYVIMYELLSYMYIYNIPLFYQNFHLTQNQIFDQFNVHCNCFDDRMIAGFID